VSKFLEFNGNVGAHGGRAFGKSIDSGFAWRCAGLRRQHARVREEDVIEHDAFNTDRVAFLWLA
jgi:hypothetical protein